MFSFRYLIDFIKLQLHHCMLVSVMLVVFSQRTPWLKQFFGVQYNLSSITSVCNMLSVTTENNLDSNLSNKI